MPSQSNNIKSNKKYIQLECFIIMIDSTNDHIRIKSKIGNYIYSPIDLVKKDDLEFLDFLSTKDSTIYNEDVSITQSVNSFYISLNIRKEYSYSFFFDIKFMIQEYLNVFHCSCNEKDKVNTDNSNQNPNLSEKEKEEKVDRIMVNEKYSFNDMFDNEISYKEYDDMKKIDMYYKSTFINSTKNEKQINENERSTNSNEDFTTLTYNNKEKNEKSDLYFKNKDSNETKANQLEKYNSQSQFLSKNEEKDELKKENLILSNSFSNKEEINKFNDSSISIHKEKELSGHFNSVICLLKLTNDVLVSGGYDSNIIIWKWKNENDQVRQMTLTGHSSSIKCLIKIEESIFASGSYDNTIRLWKIDKEIKNWVCLSVINSYENNIKEAPSSFGLIYFRSIYTNSVSKKLFIYGGTQSNLKMYEINSIIKENNVNLIEIPILPYLEINKRHKKNISQIINNPNSNLFITVSWDKSIKIWNVIADKDEKINTELVSTIQTKKMIYSACLINNDNDNEKLICGNQFGSISIYDLVKGEVIYDFKFDNESVLTVEKVPFLNGKFLILTGSNNSFVKIFDEEGRVLGKFKAHNNIVYSLLYLDDKYIASCGRESEVIIWKLSI